MGDNFSSWDGIEFEVLERPTTDSDPLVMQFKIPPEAGSPPAHVHDDLVETYEVVDGSLELLVGREWRTLQAGEKIELPLGTRHTFRNTSGTTATVRNTHAPHAQFEDFIRRYAALTHEMKSAAPTSPKTAIQGAVLWQSYPMMGTVCDQPLKTLFPVLGRVGRLLGIKPPGPA